MDWPTVPDFPAANKSYKYPILLESAQWPEQLGQEPCGKVEEGIEVEHR